LSNLTHYAQQAAKLFFTTTYKLPLEFIHSSAMNTRLSPQNKTAEHESNNLPETSAEIQNAQCYTSMSWRHLWHD